MGQCGVAAVLTSTAAMGTAMSALRADGGEIGVGEMERGRCGVSRGARGGFK